MGRQRRTRARRAGHCPRRVPTSTTICASRSSCDRAGLRPWLRSHVDLARRDGLDLDPEVIARELGVPVVETVAVRAAGITELQSAIDDMLSAPRCGVHQPVRSDLINLQRRHARSRLPRSSAKRRSVAGRIASIRSCSTPRRPLILALIMFSCSGGVRVERRTGLMDRRRRGLAVPPCRRRDAARPASFAGGRWSDRGRRRGRHVPAADPDSVLSSS